jgi:hypothetical protein
MKQKWSIYLGVLSLVAGIVLLKVSMHSIVPIGLIVLGAGLKLNFLLQKIVRHKYRPGIELVYLVTGLVIILLRKYIQLPLAGNGMDLLLGLGVALKVVFVLMFIRKVKKSVVE